MDEKIIARTEKKYIITPAGKAEIMPLINEFMEKDKFYESGIYNIYYDTDNYDFIIKSIDHPEFKQKLRARSYEGYSKVFFEIKTKLLSAFVEEDSDNNQGNKRRALISRGEFDKIARGDITLEELITKRSLKNAELQIAHEIQYFIDTFDLKPKILVYYSRESYRGDNNLRITFDSNLRYRTEDLKFLKNSHDDCLLNNDDSIIMEIKAQAALPIWLSKTLTEHNMFPQRFSKVGKAYEKITRKDKNV